MKPMTDEERKAWLKGMLEAKPSLLRNSEADRKDRDCIQWALIEMEYLADAVRRVCLIGVWGDGGVGSASPSPLGTTHDAIIHATRMESEIKKLRAALGDIAECRTSGKDFTEIAKEALRNWEMWSGKIKTKAGPSELP